VFSHLGSKKAKKELERRDKNETYARLQIERARGMWVPVDQYNDLNQLDAFIKTTKAEDTIVMFPELGFYNFLFDRPFVGRFPITTFSWFNPPWFEEYMEQLNLTPPRYFVIQKEMPWDWKEVYLEYPPNKEKYEQMLQFIHSHYQPIRQTDKTIIYQKN
jgi:hypothetical protein